MTKYKTVKRNANVGERILITKATETRGMYKNDDILTVSEVNVWGESGTVRVREQYRPIYGREYEVIIEESPSDSERITALETQVAELQAELQTLKKRKKPKHPTPNEQRKAVVERAKAFVGEGYDRWFGHSLCSEEFHVNSDKRTVVALVRGKRSKKVIARGIAKCAPDDVFNADIGKAIALGRALGLDVSEFENAPKPTEVVVGSKVRYNSNYGKDEEYSVISINHDNFSISGGEFFWNYRLTDGTCDIIDDTEAQY